MKRLFILSIILVSLSFTIRAQENHPGKQPNIIHIMCDDHSFQTISAYGHPLSKLAPTPQIDRIAEHGMVFLNAYVENSLCTPSRACLLTGLYSHQNGQRTLRKGFDSTKVFFSELLQEQGYQTGVVGKWHLPCEPKGFDYYSILYDQGDYYNPAFKTKTSNGAYIKETGYATTIITDKAIQFIENRDKAKPFCMLVHHKAPHRNWMPEGKYLDLYNDVTFPYPDNFYDDYKTRCDAARTQEMSISKNMTLIYDLKVNELKTIPPYDKEPNAASGDSYMNRFTPEQRETWVNAYSPRNKKFIEAGLTGDELVRWKYQNYLKDYLRCIKTIDDQVGRLLDYLEKEDLMENTIIVYTSDQGFYMGEHGWFDKRFMYEESFRTPLIICYPGHIKEGSVCDALVQNMDFAPTYLNLAGINKPEEMSGTSLAPLFNGTVPRDWRKYLYYHYYDYPAEHQVRRHDGVRGERYKLVHFYGEGFGKDKGNTINCNELYDLQKDPTEMNNLYGNPKYKKVTRQLQSVLDDFRTRLKVDEY